MPGLGVRGLLLALELSLPPSVVAVFKHVQALGVQGPVAAFPGPALLSRYFDETVVQGEVVANRILPTLLVVMVKRETVHDELIDAAQRRALVRCALDGHGDECNVTVWRFLRRFLAGWDEAQRRDNAVVPAIQVN